MSLSISIYRGNTDTRTVTVTSGGAAFDLTGYILKFIVKANYAVDDDEAMINKAITVADPLTGTGILTLTHAETDIDSGNYVCEIKLYKADGTYIKTLDVGSFTISNVVLKEI